MADDEDDDDDEGGRGQFVDTTSSSAAAATETSSLYTSVRQVLSFYQYYNNYCTVLFFLFVSLHLLQNEDETFV